MTSLLSLRVSVFSLAVVLSLCFAAANAAAVGFTYTPSPGLPPPENVANYLAAMDVAAVRLVDPTPAAVRAFSYTNITLLLSVPNNLIYSFARNRSSAAIWLYDHVLPFYPRSRIDLISVGVDVFSSASPAVYDPSASIVPAMRNVRLALIDLGIRSISVSTTFSFTNVITPMFPPSSGEFMEPMNTVVMRPLLQFLEDTNSSFLINLYPYRVYKLHAQITLGFALFRQGDFSFRDDVITGVRYHNLFDMMVDAVVAALAVSGHETIPIVVTETGWPSSNVAAPGNQQGDGNLIYAEMYLKGLISHLKSGMGTPLRKEGVAQTYIYQLFDEVTEKGNRSTERGQHWGVMYPNLTMKYHLDFSGAWRISANQTCKVLLIFYAVLLLLV